MNSISNLILIRHGQSEWNKQDKFTGWVDVNLSSKGIEEAKEAGLKIKQANIQFDHIYTSVLTRSIQTFNEINKICKFSVPVDQEWRLNERHYGGLQGLNKQKMREIYGDDQVLTWRRSYKARPPELSDTATSKLMNQECFLGEVIKDFPKCESLFDTFNRIKPFLIQRLLPSIKNKHNLLISAHGNSIRAMLKFFEKISDDDIVKLEIPTGKPLHLAIRSNMNIVKKEYL